jgi:membrane associated rhomboid family serine protease
MRLPERGDGGAPRPWATWALLATALAAQLAGPELAARWALVPAGPGLVALVGHLFVHAGGLHLLGTLVFLALAGPWLEARLGRALFTGTFLAAGLAGAALFVATHPGAETPWLGGSAAVAGLLGLLLACGRRGRVELLGVAAGLAPRLTAPAWALAAVFFGRELAGFANAGESALVAHAGSFAFGAVLAFAFRRTGVLLDEADVDDAREAPAKERPREPARAPLTARRPGPQRPVPGDAAALATQLADAETPEIARAYLDAEAAAGRGDAARAEVEARLWEAVEARRCPPAVALWCALVADGLVPAGPAEPLLQLAGWLRGARKNAEGTLALHASLAACDPAVAAKLARATRRSDPVVCYRAAVLALEDPALAGSEREALVGLRAEAEREVATRGIVVVPRDARAPEPAPVAPVAVRAPAASAPVAARAAPAAEPLHRPAPGEALELEPEPAPVPLALPDPAEAGDDAFLDAFHAALAEPEEPKPEVRPVRRLRVREALPRALETDALLLEVPGRKPVRLPLTRLHGVALAGVRGISERSGDKPVLIVDLLLSPEAEVELNLLRLRSDRFDPRMLSPTPEPSPLKALRRFVGELALAAHAPLLPAADVSGDAPLRIYKDLATYEREVLNAG